MKKIAHTLLVVFIIFITKQTLSIEKGKWSFVQDEDWCYIGSLPIESDLPETKKRGENYILVYKIIGSEENIIRLKPAISIILKKELMLKLIILTLIFIQLRIHLRQLGLTTIIKLSMQ